MGAMQSRAGWTGRTGQDMHASNKMAEHSSVSERVVALAVALAAPAGG